MQWLGCEVTFIYSFGAPQQSLPCTKFLMPLYLCTTCQTWKRDRMVWRQPPQSTT